jgi:DNA-binding response OmpR family regulator
LYGILYLFFQCKENVIRVLLIEDDASLCESLRRDLMRAGFAVDVARDGVQGEFLGATEHFDLAVLDLGLPDMSGLDILQRWRAASNSIPVLILTARDAWHERVDGFKAGADDYLGKPFHAEELILRLMALAKRSHGQAPCMLEVQGLRLDEEHQLVHLPDRRQQMLTAIEFRLLRCFMLQPGKVLSKSQLWTSAYESDVTHDSNVIEVYINRLRRKLGESMIVTRRGQGYVFGASRH